MRLVGLVGKGGTLRSMLRAQPHLQDMRDSRRFKAIQPVLRKHGTDVQLVVDLHGPVVQALEHLLRKAAVGRGCNTVSCTFYVCAFRVCANSKTATQPKCAKGAQQGSCAAAF